MNHFNNNKPNRGSWEGASKWYSKITGDKGHYYHDHLVLPGVLKMLDLKPGDKLLDLACGNGVLAKRISNGVDYTGFDISRSLIEDARQSVNKKNFNFFVGDVTEPLQPNIKEYSHATVILAIQNIKNPVKVFENASRHLVKGGRLVIVMNHPMFRIPRQTMWETDVNNKIQYRRVNRYLSPLEIPINIHPGQTNSPITWDFHFPLSTYSKWLNESGFSIDLIEEWVSDKESEGKMAKSENRARNEIPLFMALKCVKV